jgi:hypothetical protein
MTTTTIKPQNIVVEPFVTDKETMEMIKRIFIGIGLMIGASVLSVILYWSYQKSRSIFIVVMNLVLLAYAIEKLDSNMYYTFMGSAIAAGFIAIFMILIFLVKFFRDKSSYVPSSISSYGQS